jgi:hypothetical protein
VERISQRQDRIPEPRVVERACGGWLAVTLQGASPRVGVTASTEAEVREEFAREVARWREILASGEISRDINAA